MAVWILYYRTDIFYKHFMQEEYMRRIYKSYDELVGNTPLMELGRFAAASGVENIRILAKLERFNPTGSTKDRASVWMVREAEREGRLAQGGLIVEPTSGNTGIGVAAYAAAKGYKACIVMPESMSEERRKLIAAYGADLVLTAAALGMKGAIEEAERICAATKGSIMVGQFENAANPKAHYESTGPELWDDTQGELDVYVAGVGTGGALSGTGRYLKEKNANIEVIAVEPSASPMLTKGVSGAHAIQGIGANFVPKNYDATVVDEVLCIDNERAFECMRLLARTEGILCGVSSGAVLAAVCELGKRAEYDNKTIVCLLADTGERYLSVI